MELQSVSSVLMPTCPTYVTNTSLYSFRWATTGWISVKLKSSSWVSLSTLTVIFCTCTCTLFGVNITRVICTVSVYPVCHYFLTCYLFCQWRPALMSICLFRHPAIALIMILVLFVFYLANKLCYVLLCCIIWRYIIKPIWYTQCFKKNKQISKRNIIGFAKLVL